MGLDRLVERLGFVIVALVVAAVAYGAAAFVLGVVLPDADLQEGLPWPRFLPAWLMVALFLAALVVTLVQMPLIVLLRSRKRKLAQRLAAGADAWFRGASARAAKDSGLALIKVTGFRAHARGPYDVELS